MTPAIGITTYDDHASWRNWSARAAMLPWMYVDAVRRSGGRPVLLPPGGSAGEATEAVADLDGVVVAGGGDIDPARYGAAPHPRTGAVSAERDAWEMAVLSSALAAGVPLLAICRGIQLLNVARGGTLHQHLPQVVGHDGHSGEPAAFGWHPVRVAETGMVAGILGPGEGSLDGRWLDVPTHHHQAIDRLGRDLTASAWAADGTIEAVEPAGTARSRAFFLGVQWHPEEGDDPRLFDALVRAAGRTAGP
jgi:putative glutamine amidotransferase